MRRFLYTICFLLLCIIDQRVKTCSGLDGWLETFRDLTGLVMGILILSHCRSEDFKDKKWIPYVVWTVLSLIGGPIVYYRGIGNHPFINEWIVTVLDAILFGYVLIHTLIALFWAKKRPALHRGFTITWCVMMLWMIFSRSDSIWPNCYLIMFGSFLLTDFTEAEQKDLWHGMLDGIILSFLIMQGLCFVFRPYDMLRYVGLHANPNLNGLYYLTVLAAVFGKFMYFMKRKASWWIKLYYWLGCGTVLSFLFLTIGRTAWLTGLVLILVFLMTSKKFGLFRSFWKSAVSLALCFCLTFPLCFGAIRYLPPLFHHPVWFWGEWSTEKVHSWDPWDSEKYTDWEEFWDAALGRVGYTIENFFQHSALAMQAEAAGIKENSDVSEKPLDTRAEIALLTPEEGGDSILVRSTIYRHFFTHLNLFGHPSEEIGVQLTPTYWVGHAHNIYLQFGTDFGIPAMLLFILMQIWSSAILLRNRREDTFIEDTTYWLFLLIPTVFGLLEYCWGSGSLSIFLLFLSWTKAARRKNR